MKLLAILLLLLLPTSLWAQDDLAAKLRQLDLAVYPADSAEAKALPKQVGANQQKRLHAAAVRENEAWKAVTNRKLWERFRDPRIDDLRKSLGADVSPPKPFNLQVTRTIEGDGFCIDNLVFESRPGLVVTANLYRPAKAGDRMPGIVIVHSHHNPKHQGELLDMGMTWARQGCLVIVLDQLGHGERRTHPFTDASKYQGSFKPGRQDYYFRYNIAQQLHVAGESLMGWMVHDLRCAVTLLLAKPGIDRQKIMLFGSVAGGGDPAGCTAALDDRITLVAPFNFGGVQPDYATPKDAETAFYWFSQGYWESTRCLRLGARDGFAHWLIVGSVAPRRLLYAHEFAWDKTTDPAWLRLKKVFGFYDAGDNLAVATGKGTLKGQPPESSHCNNIGPYHRSQMYPTLKKWFALPIPEKEYQERPKLEDITCLTPEVVKALKLRPLHELAKERGQDRAVLATVRLNQRDAKGQREWLQARWTELLGHSDPTFLHVVSKGQEKGTGFTCERLVLGTEPDWTAPTWAASEAPGIVVPLVLLRPEKPAAAKMPVVVALAQEGKQRFLKERAAAVAELLQAGVAVCLPDLRGQGESSPGGGRTRTSTATSLAQTEQILGGTMLGARLKDLRAVLKHLRSCKDIDGARLALWGDSFAPVNPPTRDLAVPLDAELPTHAEPGAGLLAVLGALFEDEVAAVHVHGGLASYASLLESPYLYIPQDAIVPGALAAGDLKLLLAALSPRPLRLQALIDGLNRRVPANKLEDSLRLVRAAYERDKVGDRIHIEAEAEGHAAGRWLREQVQGK